MLQNICFSLALIVVLVPLAAFVVPGLAAVVLVHEVAEIFVIGNGVRAGRARALAPSSAGGLAYARRGPGPGPGPGAR